MERAKNAALHRVRANGLPPHPGPGPVAGLISGPADCRKPPGVDGTHVASLNPGSGQGEGQKDEGGRCTGSPGHLAHHSGLPAASSARLGGASSFGESCAEGVGPRDVASPSPLVGLSALALLSLR